MNKDFYFSPPTYLLFALMFCYLGIRKQKHTFVTGMKRIAGGTLT